MGRLSAVSLLAALPISPLPLKLTAVAPPRFDPLMVALRLVPAAPEDGLIPVIMGSDVTVKPLKAGDVPRSEETASVLQSLTSLASLVPLVSRLLAVPPV